MKKIYLYLFNALLFTGSILAQSTETFETETNNSASFTDNSQVFNITAQAGGTFDIGNFVGTGWNGTAVDNKYIDNSGSADIGIPVQFTIKSATSFKLKSIYLYLSQSNLNPGSGSCTITGKLSGVTVFTATSSTGFNSNPLLNNGFTFINFTNYGGVDNSAKIIDEYVVTTTGTFEYAALDAMTWQTIPLKVDDFNTTNFNYYPNPVNNILNLSYTTEITSAKVINIIGQTVLEQSINATSAQIDMENLPSGTYLVDINAKSNHKIIKVIKK